MKNILFSTFIFLFTLGIAIYNFYLKSYIFGWIAIGFSLIDFGILAYNILKQIRR